MAAGVLGEDVERSPDPAAATRLLDRLAARDPATRERLETDAGLRATVATVGAAGPYLSRICLGDPGALDVLGALDRRPVLEPAAAFDDLVATGVDGGGRARALEAMAAQVARFKQRELLRLAARDLTGLDDLDATVAGLSRLADDVLTEACRGVAGAGTLAVIAMGKLGAEELNYASDIDVVLVGDADPRPALTIARAAWKVDLDLRPEGRSGPMIRSMASYCAYWDRWADTWEFQALLKARPSAGDGELGQRWASEAEARLWSRPFGAEELREVRDMKRRAEHEVARRGLSDRELKLGPGGIRDVEFAVQLLQMVHGRHDADLRVRATLPALDVLAAGGYVATSDADALAEAYRWLRIVEHRVQLSLGEQAHAVPRDAAAHTRLARVLGFRDTATRPAVAQFDQVLRGHRQTVRTLHERLFFRPLLEAFTSPPPSARGERAGLGPAAVEDRLAAFGFSDAARTRQAVLELTRGFSRASRLWQQLLPLVLGWLSDAPDPDLGLLGLRAMAANPHARDQTTALVRESAESARQLCLLLGTGPNFTRDLLRNPDLLRAPGTPGLAAETPPLVPTGAPAARHELADRARRSLGWRSGTRQQQEGLQAFRRSEELRIAARDVLGDADVERTGRDLTALADAVLAVAVDLVDPQVALAVIAMGRLGGRELSYASDLDVLVVYDGADPGSTDASAPVAGAADAAAQALLALINGETPAMRVYTLDTSLRPEGRQGPVARSLDAYAAYYRRWAHTWERQALLRGRVVAGDAEVGRRFTALAEDFVWGRPFTADDVRDVRRTKARIELERIPAGEDPQFHLKLGRGSLSDIEWTVQLLQLRHGVVATGTLEALTALVAVGAIEPADATVLAEAYRFCQHTRNRLTLVRGAAADSLPTAGAHLTTLARSLDTTATGLREEYRRVTRRCRRVVERLFYEQ